ncbi:FecR family protein [Sphingobacterium multivorum]|uniref:FecR family protein n=1 Tax=Sphingobacterium multivorum TaxID=28454 RepID=UPI00289C99FC|nr:FecR domain-containing protein [Sphingobacterium multivorum]
MKDLADLLEKKATGELTPAGEKALQDWANKDPLFKSLIERIDNEELFLKDLKEFQDISTKPLSEDHRLWDAIRRDDNTRKNRFRYSWIAVVAAILVCFIYFSPYFLVFRDKQIFQTAPLADTRKDILPGRDIAFITLSNGNRLTLDDMAVGAEVTANDLHIRKDQDGSLICETQENGGDQRGMLLNHVIETPLSGQYKITLTDGTRVWLNAGSRLSFPSRFKGDERSVILEGEAFFDVRRMPEKPFKIAVKQQLVTVLGTSFNINAYPNEPNVKTTLVEGSLKVAAGNQSKIIKPGQQLLVSNGLQMSVHSTIVEDEIAWKLGYFSFRSDNSMVVLRQLERWYNIHIVMSEAVKKELKLIGKIDRKASLDQVIRMFRKSNIDCKLQGHTLILDI